MKWRFFVILAILFLRFSLGWVETSSFRRNSLIRVTGNIDNIHTNNTECIISIGRFWVNFRESCAFSQKVPVQIVGRVKAQVIDIFLGRLWLSNATLSVLPTNNMSTAEQGVLQRSFISVRENIVSVYRRFLPEPETGLVAGIILGYKNDIGRDFYEQMVKSGTIHIAVASGYNIMLVGGTILSICFWRLKRKWASLVAASVMLIYAIEAGGEPPVIRALIMTGMIFWAAVIGRKTVGWWALLIAGWIMILFDPLVLVSMSFQLSMAASVGLIVVEPWINKSLSVGHERAVEILSGTGIITSLATMLTTAPIIWWNFGRVSWISIVSNTLILPLVPVLMITGAAMQILPAIFVWPTYAVAHWMVEVIRFFGS